MCKLSVCGPNYSPGSSRLIPHTDTLMFILKEKAVIHEETSRSKMSSFQWCCSSKNLNACKFIAVIFGLSRVCKEYQGLMTKFKQIKMMVIGIEIFFGIYLISNILLLIGSIKKIKGLLITWTIYAVIGIALELIFAFKHEKLDKRADNTCSNCKKCIYCVGNHSRLWRNERNRRTKKRT